jgi:ArsR family transcriptional regulator
MKAGVFKALGHPLRLAIVEALRDAPACVCDIADAVGAERSNVSRHLAMMQRAGIITSRKDGLMVYYELRTPCVLDVFTCVEDVLRGQLADAGGLLRRLNRGKRRAPARA